MLLLYDFHLKKRCIEILNCKYFYIKKRHKNPKKPFNVRVVFFLWGDIQTFVANCCHLLSNTFLKANKSHKKYFVNGSSKILSSTRFADSYWNFQQQTHRKTALTHADNKIRFLFFLPLLVFVGNIKLLFIILILCFHFQLLKN